ncbi:TPA: phage tail protein [Escherichia coli]|nr:phage tail protein [Escherichia coli]
MDTPIKRGKTEITEIVLRKPQSGALRGTRLQAIMDMDVNAMMTVIPRISSPALTAQEIAEMAEQGKAWPLIEGSGTIYGMYVIEGLNQTKTEFFRDGMPRRIEFTLSLKRVDESLSDMFGDLSAQLNNLQDTATSALSDISKTVGGLLS